MQLITAHSRVYSRALDASASFSGAKFGTLFGLCNSISTPKQSNYSAKEPVCRNGSPLSDESKDGIKRGLPVFPGSVGNGMESVESIGAGIGTEAT